MQTMKRWLNQKCIGYQERPTGLWAVFEGDVEFTDSTIAKRWKVYPPFEPFIPDRNVLLDTCPVIHIPAK